MARAGGITFQEFRTRFSTEDACRAELFRLRLPEMRVYEILPSSRAKHVPVPCLPASNVRHRRDGHAPHAPAADGLILDNFSLCHEQTRHFRRSAEPHAEHLLRICMVSFAPDSRRYGSKRREIRAFRHC